MRALTAPDLLKVWEAARLQPPMLRSVFVLVAAAPEVCFDEILQLPLGQKELLLLELYGLLFGNDLAGCAQCPKCGDYLEVTIPTSDMQTRAAQSLPAHGIHELTSGGYRIRFRLPSTEDLLAAAADAAAAEAVIISRCVHDIYKGRRRLPTSALTGSVREQLSARMLELDPLAEVLLDLACPACAHTWQMVLDVGDFLWSSIVVCVERLLSEVHALASAYGWTENEILNLSQARRQYYLEAVS